MDLQNIPQTITQPDCIYAVRKGKYIQRCLFFSWQDVQPHLDCHDVDYKQFAVHDLHSAMTYVMGGDDATQFASSKEAAVSVTTNQNMNAALAGDEFQQFGQNMQPEQTNTPNVATTARMHASQMNTTDGMPPLPSNINNNGLLEPLEDPVHVDIPTENAHNFALSNDLEPIVMGLDNATAAAAVTAAAVVINGEITTDSSLVATSNNPTQESAKRKADSSHEQDMSIPERPDIEDREPSVTWKAGFQRLQKYVEKHGTMEVDLKVEENKIISRWIVDQRFQYRRYVKNEQTSMTPTKTKLLQSLNFDFKQKRKHKKRKVEVTRNSETEKKWKEMFDAFIEYKKEHNDPDVKKTEETMALYNWMMQQRAEYKKLATTGESKLSAMKIQQLNDAGFKFAKRSRYTKWSDRIKQLKSWKEKNGHLKIPINDPELGEFASRQRTEYTRFLEGHTDIGLTKERVKQLTDMGFIFSSGKRYDPSRKGIKRKTWEERFNQFLEFKQKHGHGFVTQQGDTDGLGEWVKSVSFNFTIRTECLHLNIMVFYSRSYLDFEIAT